MKTIIYSAKNISDYNDLVKNLNLDIYYQGNYLKIEADRINGILEIFCALENNKKNIFIYPYIKLKLKGDFSEYYDLTSPYGYCGPYCNNIIFFKDAEKEFNEYIKKENIVSEFVRYHFIYNKKL